MYFVLIPGNPTTICWDLFLWLFSAKHQKKLEHGHSTSLSLFLVVATDAMYQRDNSTQDFSCCLMFFRKCCIITDANYYCDLRNHKVEKNFSATLLKMSLVNFGSSLLVGGQKVKCGRGIQEEARSIWEKPLCMWPWHPVLPITSLCNWDRFSNLKWKQGKLRLGSGEEMCLS